ncbi:sensor histidine kinase [Halomonas litopenaei]|uniref:sensor histidine kinase n=1 Tax=Halomonas litopenaei TaxID=2109328 RepID=UPI001A90C110|nr:HAMP domain-containing sensor histidine kinase [Halomonas litopenaei]MBN8411470.1 HAMP domain-containing histidine kinase [Halomonas litopenaei]
MLKTLYSKIAVLITVVTTLMGLAIAVSGYALMRQYHEEVTQKLNAPIADYIARQYQFSQVEDLQATLDALAALAMTVNPSVEIYLLDASGRILSHVANDNPIRRQQVALAPVEHFIARDARQATLGRQPPLYGTDPRSIDGDKTFSATRITLPNGAPGYLYAILGGKTYDTIASDLLSSYIAKIALLLLVSILLTSLLISLLSVRFITQRIGRLLATMQGFTRNDFVAEPADPNAFLPDDEIYRLYLEYDAMASRISAQFESLKNMDRLRKELISNVSHDLRTPVATIQAYTETVQAKRRTLDDGQLASHLSTIENSCLRLSRLIDDLFELSRLETGHIEPRREVFSILELVYDIVQEFSLCARDKGVTLYTPATHRNIQVFADVQMIQRVLQNLIRNALCHCPSGGKISITLEEDHHHVYVCVSDTGCGIDDKDLPYIFNRYYQSDDTPHKDRTTSGLGLSIVRGILELHQSRIGVRSQVDQGSDFFFHLPAVP